MKRTPRLSMLFILCLLGQAALLSAAEKPRNPFGVKDVPDPDGADVQEFVKQHLAELTGAKTDANSEQWVAETTDGKRGSLEGNWFERWGKPGLWFASPRASELKVVGDRVYILANCANGRFLVDLKRDQNRLIGRYQGIDNPADSSPCVFLIVDDERLDGRYSGARWDFRRKLTK